jgi:Zn-dependent peptidase ImmA (M78 family)/DNA-binding XRE family transcriptional regulator
MDSPFVAERLTLARERRGLNKSQLATLIGKKAPTITAYERADREPPTRDVVERLATELKFPIEFFYTPVPQAVPRDAASFRALTRMTAGQRSAALASGTLCIEFDRWISERFDRPQPQVPDLDPLLIDPQAAAIYVRTQWGLGTSPLADVLQTLESFGVRVFALADECREVDAFSFWAEETGTPFIIIGTHKTPERQVFDLAHELAHLVLHRDHAAPRGRAEEREADAFASSFLMPRDDLVIAAPPTPSFDDLIRAKHRWKVSVAALAYRMNHLGMLSDWSYHNVCVHLARVGRHREPSSLPREQSQVLNKVLRALRGDGMRLSQIASELHLRVDDLQAMLNGLVTGAIDGEGHGQATSRPDLRIV